MASTAPVFGFKTTMAPSLFLPEMLASASSAACWSLGSTVSVTLSVVEGGFSRKSN